MIWPQKPLLTTGKSFSHEKKWEKLNFFQNHLESRFWALGFFIYTLSCAKLKKIQRDTFHESHCMFLPLVYSFGRWWQLPKEVLQNEGGSKVFGIFLKIHLYCHKRFPKTSQIIKDIHHQHNQVLSWHLQKTQSYHSGLDVMDWVIESVT